MSTSKSGSACVNKAEIHLPLLAAIVPLLTLFLAVTATPAAAQYVYTAIPGPSGNSFVQVTGVNDTGTVVGQFGGPDGHVHGFLWTGGTNYTTFDFPGAVGTFPTGINSAGVIVGSWDDTSGFCHAFSGTIGNFTTLNIFGSPQTFANAINNKGEIVGAWEDANSIIHGFTDINGAITSFDFPVTGVLVTFPLGVNDFGQIVGQYTPSGPFPRQSFILTPNATPTTLALPDGSTSFDVGGIDDAGDIAGVDREQSTSNQFVVLDSGTATFLTPFGFTSGFLFGLNSSQISSSGGDIVGNVNGEGFLARGPVLIDPVPDLINGGTNAVSPSLLQSLGATGRRFVKGVAADGVTEAVIRIPAQNAGDQFTITLKNDQNSSKPDPNLDGALGNPGDTSFTQGQITVTAENVTVTAPDGSTSSVPFAFAVYHAPIDFVRETAPDSYFTSGSCPYASAPAGFAVAFGPPPTGPTATIVGPPQTDDQLACRMVSLQVEDLTQNTSSSVRLPILRPPVVMIHGLWDNSKAWDNFSPLWTDPTHADSRFSVGRVSYDNPVSVSFSIPAYSPDQLQNVEANSLGFAFNAPGVLSQIKDWIGMFKDGSENPLHLPVAGVQADIVAHSMGGDVTRTLVLQADFLRPANFGQGDIHKLITIDTPHLGSILASDLLSSQENGGCLQNLLAKKARYVFAAVTLSNGLAADGAIGDLEPGSDALSNLANQGQHPIPTALIAGIYTNFGVLDDIPDVAFFIRHWPFGCPSDPLAQDLTSTGWPAIFNDQNDAIVPVSSQVNGPTIGSTNNIFIFTGASGLVHSPGTEKLGFAKPSVLDPGDVPNEVIKLLNTSITQSAFGPINP